MVQPDARFESARTMTDNLAIWSKVEVTDPSKTKAFTRGGGFRGTATNATWLAKRATEIFGPCGIGWGVKVLDERLLDGAPLSKTPDAVAKVHRVHIQFWYMLDGARGEIEHFGQTEFVGENKNGAFTDEEAPKKSLTDAMTKALSLLGFAADIHMGLFDDSKYVNSVRERFATATKRETDGTDESVSAYVTQALKDIETFRTPGSLKDWWTARRQQDMRAALGITQGTPEYTSLFMAFVARGTALSKASEAA